MQRLSLLDWRPASTVGWTDESRALLVRLYEENEIPDTADISRALRKSISAVTSYASRMGLTSRSPHAKMRECRMCERDFMSDWAGNRICDVCKRSETYRCA